MIKVNDEVIVNMAPIIGSPVRQPSGRYAKVLDMPRLTAQQQADDYFAANPSMWFVTIGGCMFARRVP